MNIDMLNAKYWDISKIEIAVGCIVFEIFHETEYIELTLIGVKRYKIDAMGLAPYFDRLIIEDIRSRQWEGKNWIVSDLENEMFYCECADIRTKTIAAPNSEASFF